MHFLHQVDKDDNDQCKQNRLGAGTAFGLPLHSFHFQKNKKICVFESDILHILLANSILSTTKQFREIKKFIF